MPAVHYALLQRHVPVQPTTTLPYVSAQEPTCNKSYTQGTTNCVCSVVIARRYRYELQHLPTAQQHKQAAQTTCDIQSGIAASHCNTSRCFMDTCPLHRCTHMLWFLQTLGCTPCTANPATQQATRQTKALQIQHSRT
jgi:hypothetical protein